MVVLTKNKNIFRIISSILYNIVGLSDYFDELTVASINRLIDFLKSIHHSSINRKH